MQSSKEAYDIISRPSSRDPNAQKYQSKHKLLNETDLTKTQVYKNSVPGSSLKNTLNFNNTTSGLQDKTARFLFPNNQKLVICEKQNIKTTHYSREKFDTRKIIRENSGKDFEQSMNYFEINMPDKENICTDPEVNNIHNPSLISITRFKQCIRETTIIPNTHQMHSRENSFILLTGSVENILVWSKVKTGLQVLFEVTAILEGTQEGKWKWEKILLLSDSKTSSKLSVYYYEIDRELPKLQGKSTITCVGKFMSGNSLQAYKVKQSSENEKNDCQRLAFICNRTAEEMTMWNETKSKTPLSSVANKFSK